MQTITAPAPPAVTAIPKPEPWRCVCRAFIGYEVDGRLRIGNAFVNDYVCVRCGTHKRWRDAVPAGPMERRSKDYFDRLPHRWDRAGG